MLTFVQALLGDLWHRINPWMAPYRLMQRLLRRAQPVLPYPGWLGYWPALMGFGGFAWFELVDLAPDDPVRLALAILAYADTHRHGAVRWRCLAGARRSLQRLPAPHRPSLAAAAIPRPNHRRLYLVLPGSRLFNLPAMPLSGVLFVLLTLSAVSFDGLAKTFWWLDQGGINPLEFPGRSAVMELNSIGLFGTWAALAAAYLLVVGLGTPHQPGAAGGPRCRQSCVSIIPISLAYHFSHYLTVLLVDVQYAALALSDPLGRGWNLLGLERSYVTTSFLSNYHSVVMIWNLQAGAVVAGHPWPLPWRISSACGWVAARAPPFGQVPLAALMVLYTLFGLWLLSAPVAG